MKTRLSLLLTLILPPVVVFAQGNLAPPGAPAPTMKTLDQVEPRKPIDATNTPGDSSSVYRITAPGSYYLTAVVSGASGKSGIVIAASHVTVDLSGFTLTGGSGSLSGILVTSGQSDLTVMNGNVTNWGNGGVDAVDCNNSSFTNLEANGNTLDGLRLGPNNTAKNCRTRNNGVHGISFNGQATIVACTSDNNGGSGFVMAAGVVSDSLASSNASDGFASRAASFHHCLARENGHDGFFDAFNNARSSGKKGAPKLQAKPAPDAGPGNGVNAGSYFDCVSNSNGNMGFDLDAGPMNVNACTADSNSNQGIHTGGGSTITNCIVTNGSSDGIATSDGSTVTGCTARNNITGIFSSGSSRIVQNECDGNYWNIISYGDYQRFDSNTCTGGGYGIYLTGANNLVIRNSASNASVASYDIATGNKLGVIVNAPASGAVSGSTGGAGVGTTDPWANFTY